MTTQTEKTAQPVLQQCPETAGSCDSPADPKAVVERFIRTAPAVSRIQPQDQEIFREFARLTNRPGCYAAGWSYLTQAANHTGDYDLGLKYCDGQRLVAIGFYPRPATKPTTWHFHFIRPLGAWWEEDDQKKLVQLCAHASSVSGQPMYIKKLFADECARLRRWGQFVHPVQLPWHPIAIAEDDTFPERIVDVRRTLNLVEGPTDNEMRNKFGRFVRRYAGNYCVKDYDISLRHDAELVVNRFFQNRSERQVQVSTADDYQNMITYLPHGRNGHDWFSSLLYVADEPVGFYLAERLPGDASVGVYANMALYQQFPYCSEFVLIHLFQRLRQAGISVANLGGSETEGLDHFKLKFRPAQVQNMNWLVYMGIKGGADGARSRTDEALGRLPESL